MSYQRPEDPFRAEDRFPGTAAKLDCQHDAAGQQGYREVEAHPPQDRPSEISADHECGDDVAQRERSEQ